MTRDRGEDSDLEFATLACVDWFNHRRLFHEPGRVPPAKAEDRYYVQTESHHNAMTHTTQTA